MAKKNSKSSIPEIHLEQVLRWNAEGKGQREIAALMLSEHGVVTSHTSVGRFLREVIAERKEGSLAIVAERAAKSTTTDLDILDGLQSDLLDGWNETKENKGIVAALPIADRLLAVTATKLKAVGVGEESSKDLASLMALAFQPSKN